MRKYSVWLNHHAASHPMLFFGLGSWYCVLSGTCNESPYLSLAFFAPNRAHRCKFIMCARMIVRRDEAHRLDITCQTEHRVFVKLMLWLLICSVILDLHFCHYCWRYSHQLASCNLQERKVMSSLLDRLRLHDLGSVVYFPIVFLLGQLVPSSRSLPRTKQSSLQFSASLRQPKSSLFSHPTMNHPKTKQQGDQSSYYATSPPLFSFSQ